MENKKLLRRIRFSTDSYLTLISLSVTGKVIHQGTRPVFGGLLGKREENLVYVIDALPLPDQGKDETDPVDPLTDLIKEEQRRRKGVDVVGWYVSSQGMDLGGPPEIRDLHEEFEFRFPGSFLVIIDQDLMERNTAIKDYLGIYGGMRSGSSPLRDPSNVPGIEVDLDLSKIVRRFSELGRKGSNVSNKNGENSDGEIPRGNGTTAGINHGKPLVGRKKRGKEKRGKVLEQPKSPDPMVALDTLSQNILKLKGYLAKLKKESVQKTHDDKTWLTKRIKFLKMKQMALLDDINAQIARTKDIQMRIAFYKTRDSLAKDMKLLDDLISEQYMETLTDLVRMGAEKSN